MKYRYFYFVFLLCTYPALGSDELATCYSVQLRSGLHLDCKSFPLPQGCQEMHISSYTAQRCGCFNEKIRAKNALAHYKQTYPNAILVKTYKYRFKKVPSLQKKTPIKKVEKRQISQWNITSQLLKENFSFQKSSSQATHYQQNNLYISLGKNQKDIQQSFMDFSSFYGLSLQGKYEQYLNQDYRFREYTDYEYDLKLEFDLFKDGYFEHKKANTTTVKQEQIKYLQTFSYVLKNHYDEQLLIANAALQVTNIKYYKALSRLYKEAIKHRKKSYINNLSTQDELEALEQKYNRYTKTAKIYAQHKKLFLPNEAIVLLDKIEALHLQESETILKLAKEHNPSAALQKARVSLLDETPSYSDNLTLGFYGHRRVVDEMGWYNTIGIEGKLPLDFTSNEAQKVAKLEQYSHQLAQKSFENIVQNKLTQLMQNFSDLQQLIAIDKDEIRFLHKRIERYKTIESNAIPNLNYNPEDKIISLSAQLISLKYQIALKKIELFKTLGNIAYLSNTPDISLLIKGHQ